MQYIVQTKKLNRRASATKSQIEDFRVVVAI